MARLNTIKPPKLSDPRLRPKSGSQTEPASPSRTEPRNSPTRTKEAKQWPLREGETGTGSGILGTGHKPTLQKSRSQRSGKNSGGSFDIFYDGDAMNEKEEQEETGDSSPRGSEGENKSPLKTAKVNSLLLAVPQQGRSRPTRKSEVDYDKENDVAEEEVEDEYSQRHTTRRSPPRRAENLQQSPGRNGIGRQLWAYREPETDGEEGGEEEEDNGFDSLDDFIVSDNEEISYHETSDSETEDELTPPPPPPSKRRLFRGRRPAPETENQKESESFLQKDEIPPEPALPSELAMSPLMSDSRQKEMSQNGLSIDEKMDRLSLENNGASSQLEKDLSW